LSQRKKILKSQRSCPGFSSISDELRRTSEYGSGIIVRLLKKADLSFFTYTALFSSGQMEISPWLFARSFAIHSGIRVACAVLADQDNMVVGVKLPDCRILSASRAIS
jgi:hypothetical protein